MTAHHKRNKRIIKYLIFSLLLIFAAVGLFLSLAFLAIKLKLTNDGGSIDANNRYFSLYRSVSNSDTTSIEAKRELIFAKIAVINRYRPQNALNIIKAMGADAPYKDVERMIFAVKIQLLDNEAFNQEFDQIEANFQGVKNLNNKSAFEWMNIAEWQDFKIAVAKDKELIDSVSNETGVESRLIVTVLVAEQIRLFNSNREAYKKWIGPLKILSVERNFSFGVTGIKEETAIMVENNLKDTTSLFYPGKKYQHQLDFYTSNPANERYQRLTTYKNHRYSYVYAALILRQLKQQWQNAGFPIDDRPEILSTLFNLGFNLSKPKADPQVGGATIEIYGNEYTFGAISYQFYYSGELVSIFPYKAVKFE